MNEELKKCNYNKYKTKMSQMSQQTLVVWNVTTVTLFPGDSPCTGRGMHTRLSRTALDHSVTDRLADLKILSNPLTKKLDTMN